MSCKTVITIKAAAVAVALGALTSIALAESIELTDVQMDRITAGFYRDELGNLSDQYGFVAWYDRSRGIYGGPSGIYYTYDPSTDTLTSLDGGIKLIGNSLNIIACGNGICTKI